MVRNIGNNDDGDARAREEVDWLIKEKKTDHRGKDDRRVLQRTRQQQVAAAPGTRERELREHPTNGDA